VNLFWYLTMLLAYKYLFNEKKIYICIYIILFLFFVMPCGLVGRYCISSGLKLETVCFSETFGPHTSLHDVTNQNMLSRKSALL
jgi:hypothetical protein